LAGTNREGVGVYSRGVRTAKRILARGQTAGDSKLFGNETMLHVNSDRAGYMRGPKRDKPLTKKNGTT